MRQIIDSVILQNRPAQKLRIYRISDSSTLCIALDEEGEHFEIEVSEVEDVISSLKLVAGLK